MALRLADRLNLARQERFVGRARERTILEEALAAGELPFLVLYVFGPGGVGKTTLLREYMRQAEAAGAQAIYLDGRNTEPAPEAFLAGVRQTLGIASIDSPYDALAARQRRQLLLIDTYETLAPLDGWIREVFLPQLPGDVLIVLAGRDSPSLAWRADPGWQRLVRTVPLRNLSEEEGRTYLLRRAVPPDQHEAVLDFTHGHPLALSLVADAFDQQGGLQFEPAVAPDIIRSLLQEFVQAVPSPLHRTALEACALVRAMSEAILAAMLGLPNALEHFDWLRGLSFVDAGPEGLFLHDLARDALSVDLRWRNTDRYVELHRRARDYYTARLGAASGAERQRLLLDLIYLHREGVLRSFFEWRESGAMLVEPACASDVAELVAMVERHEGGESAAWAAAWLERDPSAALVMRGEDGRVAGFVYVLALETADERLRDEDPAARAAWHYLSARAPLRRGERATLFRFWMDREGYQAVSPVQSLIFINVVAHYLTTPDLAFTFFPCADPDFWLPVFTYGSVDRLPEADFEVGGRHYGVFAHDWRVVPPAAWLAILAEREVATSGAASGSGAGSGTAATMEPSMDRGAFGEALRDALRNYTRPQVLRKNPLLRSRVLLSRAGDSPEAERVSALRKLVRETAETLQSAPRDVKYYRALHQTYFEPALSQEKAAALLRLPFSTYRHHLQGGIDRLTELLWDEEMRAGSG